LAPLADLAKQRGVQVYHLNIGQPDIPSPPEFFEGLRRYQEQVVAYEPSRGNLALCKSWSRSMNRSLQLETDQNHFVITAGASEAILFSIMAVTDPGDEILVFDPSYANYLGFAAMAGITLVGIPTTIQSGFALPSIDEIATRITPRTKAVLVCSPNNPTGTLMKRAEMERLLELARSRGLFIISDEAYREFVYDGATPVSFLHLEPRNPALIITDSLSKRYSLCGARIGTVISVHDEVRAAVQRMASARLAVSSIEQVAAAYMLDTIPADFLSKALQEYQQRRDLLVRGLEAIPGSIVVRPQGAFYTIVELPVRSGDEFAEFMLREFDLNGRTTFVAPGSGFHVAAGGGKRQVRVAYVLALDELRGALETLAAGVEAFQRKYGA
jgi:aspartate aminotransferase